jgi:hypothetical protein
MIVSVTVSLGAGLETLEQGIQKDSSQDWDPKDWPEPYNDRYFQHKLYENHTYR